MSQFRFFLVNIQYRKNWSFKSEGKRNERKKNKPQHNKTPEKKNQNSESENHK